MKRSLLFFIATVVCCLTLDAQTDHFHVNKLQQVLKLDSKQIDEIYVTDHYTSQGITHTYFKESIYGIPVYNSTGAVHEAEGFAPMLVLELKEKAKNAKVPKNANLSAKDAVEKVADRKGVEVDVVITKAMSSDDRESRQVLSAPRLSSRSIGAKLQYYIIDSGEIKLAWEFATEDPTTAWLTDHIVDATTGEMLEEISWTVSCSHDEVHDHTDCAAQTKKTKRHASERNVAMMPNTYQVYPWPIESPNFGVRSAAVAPWEDNMIASPNGWHTVGTTNYTTTRGNNTDTYLDDDNTNGPTGGDAARADGGATLEFIFDLDITEDPNLYKEAAITNTFYWTNLMHDVWYNYGFDEPSGNFQEENYAFAGIGTDYVFSEVQDGSGTCNANFGTPPDGGNPRMQMYLCNGRDGDYDNGVIAHEYGHGISNRLTGGPAAAGCLGNQEQMGEGWSDYLGMVMTIEAGDEGEDSRGMGTWLFGQGPGGDGIRPNPYSTDFAINPNTYDDIKTFSVPHGVGSVWCTMLWDMTWALIDEYGFDPDIYDGIGGNNIAMRLVTEGMKLQPCRPGFVDGRDAIIAADELIYGGVNKCLIWRVFAQRGLGLSADQGDTGSRGDGTEAFDLPVSCQAEITKSTTTETAMIGDEIIYDLTVANQLDVMIIDFLLTDSIPDELEFISATNGGTESGGVVSFPLFDVAAESSVTYQVTLRVRTGEETVYSDIADDMESGAAQWNTSQSGSISWTLQSDESNSGANAWYANNEATVGEANLDLAGIVGVGDLSEISFFHRYETETSWDGGRVLISTDEGGSWQDLGSRMINNGYKSLINNRFSGFSGNSNGYLQTVIDLSIYAGKKVLIRFQMTCDNAVGGDGWYIDDFVFTNIKPLTINRAAISSGTYYDIDEADAVEVLPSVSDLTVTLTSTDLVCFADANGEANVVASGGSGSYSYSWADGAVGSTRNDLSAGTHEVTISDGNESIVKRAIVMAPTELILEVASTFITNTNQDNGSATAIVAGGSPSYTYLWNTGATTQTITNLIAGIYSVTITDSGMCTLAQSVIVRGVDCGDAGYDSGGAAAAYSNQEDITTVLCPDNPLKTFTITFNSFDVESNWDALYIYNGNSTASPLFDSGNGPTQANFPAGGYYGTTNPGTFASTDNTGCITLRFRSDNFVTGAGWEYDVTCEGYCTLDVDSQANDGFGSLRRAIECAGTGDTVQISAGLHLETITLDESIMIDDEVIVEMGGGNMYNINMSKLQPLFVVLATGSLELNNVNLLSAEIIDGAAVFNNGVLKLNDVTIYENEDLANPNSLIFNNGTVEVKGNTQLRKE